MPPAPSPAPLGGASQVATLAQLAPAMDREFGAGAVRGLDWKRAFAVIGQLLESGTKRNFQLGRTPDGLPWKPLARPRPGPRRGGKDLPLRDTGVLMASLTSRGFRHFERVSGSLFEWGSNVEYAGVHNFGWEHVPKREFLGLNRWILDQIEAYLAEEVARQLGGGPSQAAPAGR